ncbi:MAG: CRISPR-associated endonuclease Cas2 [Myxococcales bacterium]|nr:CRISPR-associated endonuclease Cas2 [Myxococcales bacterium]
MHLYLITYDVCTKEEDGAARLRRLAKACEGRGCRVQKSVFECRLTLPQLEELRYRMLNIIDLSQDSLRIYRLTGPLEQNLEIHGLDHSVDFTEPLIF